MIASAAFEDDMAIASGLASPFGFGGRFDQIAAAMRLAAAVPSVGSQNWRRPIEPQASMKMNKSAIGAAASSRLWPSEFNLASRAIVWRSRSA